MSRLEARVDAIDGNIGALTGEMSSVQATLGRAPDPLGGTEGTGAVGLLYKIGNKILSTPTTRGTLTSVPETAFTEFLDDESESTKVQNRVELVQRSRVAEEAAEKANTKVRLALIGLGVTIVTSLATIAAAWLTKGD